MKTTSAIGTVLLGLIAFSLSTPDRALAARQGAPKTRHVYTNDDPEFNHPSISTADVPADKPPGSAPAEQTESERLAPFVATPTEVVEKMLDMAQVTASDVVYDLGSGDGRIVIMAAQKYGAHGIGVELDRHLVEESTDNVTELKLEGQVKILQKDLLQTDLKDATVVAVYLLPGANEKLRPILEKDLKAGTRVVTHDMGIPGWEPTREESLMVGSATHFVYRYDVPDAFRNKQH